MQHTPPDAFSLLLVILIMLNGFAFLVKGKDGVIKMNRWLVKQMRRVFGAAIIWFGTLLRGH